MGNVENFGLRTQKHNKHVVVPDLHGEYELAQKVIDIYFDAEDICFVFLGDLLDKRHANKGDKGIFNTIELIKNLGERAVITIANHEWTTLAALYDRDLERRTAHELGAREFYGNKSTIESYGIDTETISDLEEFKKKIVDAEHDRVLLSATPYYETDKFIAVHAGLEHNWDWEDQKEYLIKVAREMADGVYELQPSAWFSTELATDIKPIQSTEKIVVSGHAHNLINGLKGFNYPIKTSPERVVNDGRRVRLASQLNTCSVDPLYVWQDWDGEVVTISRD